MKLILISFLFITTSILGQSVHQEQIVSFIEKNIGKRVGDGICETLIDKAYSQWNKKWDDKPAVKGGSAYGIEIEFSDIEPGDIILTKNEIDLDGSKKPSHIMFVYKIENNSIYIAHQNVNAETLKESKVIITKFDYDIMVSGSKKITIKAYRSL